MVRILFVCHGNICRSTMAEFVMAALVHRAGLAGEFVIASSATSREEIGADTHPGTKRELQAHAVPYWPRMAVQLTAGDYTMYDYIIGMDAENIRNIKRITNGDPDGKVQRLLSFSRHERDVADPWYTGDFSATWQDVLTGCKGLLHYIQVKQG